MLLYNLIKVSNVTNDVNTPLQRGPENSTLEEITWHTHQL